jgi:ABC-type transport system substrate-binding protein
MPIPEANSRLAALRSGQVDWIEVPPPDGIGSLKSAGFTITTGSYPHVWPWFYNIGAPTARSRMSGSPGAELLHRSGRAGVAAQRHRGAVGRLAQASDPDFGAPVNRYKFDPAKGKALLREAGYTPAKPLRSRR